MSLFLLDVYSYCQSLNDWIELVSVSIFNFIKKTLYKNKSVLEIVRFIAFAALLLPSLSFANVMKVAVFKDHYPFLKNYVFNEQCPDLKSTDFNNNQMLAELLILCNALKAVKYKVNIELVPYPVSARVLQGIEKEDILISGYGVWHQELSAHNLTATQALLNKSEFTKGLYTTKTLSKQLSISGKFTTADLIVVANQNWQLDWQELKCAGFNLWHVDQYEQMVKMVKLNRVDLVPLFFSPRKDLQQTLFDIPLFPVKGVKIAIKDSLHFAINTTSSEGKRLHKALELGLSLLREQGLIKEVYQRLGITNPLTQKWKTLGCMNG